MALSGRRMALSDRGIVESEEMDISEEVVTQIKAKAEFNANLKVIVTADQIIGTTLDIKS